MSDGSIDIDDIEGDVSGVIKDSIGGIGAKIVNVGNLVIHNSTTKERVTLKKIQHLSIEKNAIGKGIITTDEFNALQRVVIEIKNLLERNQANEQSDDSDDSLQTFSKTCSIMDGKISKKSNMV